MNGPPLENGREEHLCHRWYYLWQMFPRFCLTCPGATGTGKSQLSIDLAKALNGQVLNGDALQIYRTANILTNKVTPEETGDVEHHLMDFLAPTEKYDVYRFKAEAIQLVALPSCSCSGLANLQLGRQNPRTRRLAHPRRRNPLLRSVPPLQPAAG
jgi:hypothetical protein